MYYEVLYYLDEDLNNFETVEFKSKKKALKFYEQHKDEYYGWWITKRDSDNNILEDIVY